MPPEEAVKEAFHLGSLLGHETNNKNVLIKTLQEAAAEEIVILAEKLRRVSPRIKLLYFQKL